MEMASPKAPENLENYLSQIESCKEQINKLNSQISYLKEEKLNIESENINAFEALKDKILLNMKESSESLKSAKIHEADCLANSQELDEKLKGLGLSISNHEADKERFKEERANALNSLRGAELAANKLKSDNELINSDLLKHKQYLNELEASLSIKASDIKIKEEELSAQALQNQSQLNQIENEKNILASQYSKIHQDINDYAKQKDEDLENLTSIANKCSADKRANEIILQEIKDRSERLQELIINQKIMSASIDKKNSDLKIQQDRISEMTLTLQNLKNELSKDDKTQEVSK